MPLNILIKALHLSPCWHCASQYRAVEYQQEHAYYELKNTIIVFLITGILAK